MHPHLSTASEAQSWLQANDIRRVELVFADLTSVARGKVMSTASFVETLAAKMPEIEAFAAAGVENLGAPEVCRQPIEQGRPHRIASGPYSRADAGNLGVRGQVDPRLPRGAVEIGRQRLAPVIIFG